MKSLIVLALVLSACHRDVAGDSLDGAQIFHDACVRCHGPTGKPDAVMVARLGVKDLTAPDLRAKITPELVSHQVHHGSQNGFMPSFVGTLTEAQIQAVAKYVASPEFLKRAPK